MATTDLQIKLFSIGADPRTSFAYTACRELGHGKSLFKVRYANEEHPETSVGKSVEG